MSAKLKICGMKFPSNIAEVAALEPDYLGFIFYKGSSRYIADLSPSVLQNLSLKIKTTGVFVNEDLPEVIETSRTYQLKAIQLHGNESPDYCAALKRQLPGLELIKAFGIGSDFNFESLKPYVGKADYFLFDTQTAGHGGSGKVFDWSLLKQYKESTPYFLSGGIGLSEAEFILQVVDSRLYAVDLNSKFEVEAGLKDPEKLKKFKNILSGSAQ